jgi:hypothetical protein
MSAGRNCKWIVGKIQSSGAPGVYLCTATLLLLSISVTGVAAAPATCLAGTGALTMSAPAGGAQFCSRYCFACVKGDGACDDAEIASGTVKLIYAPILDRKSPPSATPVIATLWIQTSAARARGRPCAPKLLSSLLSYPPWLSLCTLYSSDECARTRARVGGRVRGARPSTLTSCVTDPQLSSPVTDQSLSRTNWRTYSLIKNSFHTRMS